MKKTVALLCALIMLMLPLLASARLDMQLMASQKISDANVRLNPSGNTLYAKAVMSTSSTASELGFSYIYIQEHRNNSWITVQGAYYEYTYNNDYHSYTVSYTGEPGKTYRAIAGFWAVVNGEAESRASSSGSVGL